MICYSSFHQLIINPIPLILQFETVPQKSLLEEKGSNVHDSPCNPLTCKEIVQFLHLHSYLSQTLFSHTEANLFGKGFISGFYLQSLISWSSILEADSPISFLHSTFQNSCPFLDSFFYNSFLFLRDVFLLLVIFFGLTILAFPLPRTPVFYWWLKSALHYCL